MKTWSTNTALAILVLCSIVPFASRAVYMDEHQYLDVARFAAEKDWRFPQEMSWVFFGIDYANMATQTHPPVVEYYLACLFRLFGHFDEAIFRLFFSVFPVMAILAFHRVAKRFTDKPLLVTSLFAVSPAFFVMNPSLMMDVPMLAFMLMGLSFYLNYINGDSAQLWPASLCFILAAGAGYVVLVPVGCLFVWAVSSGRAKREWFALAAAPAAVFMWLLILRIHFGVNVPVKWSNYWGLHFSFSQNLLPMLSFIGGIGMFPWTFVAVADVPRWRMVAILSISTAIVTSFFYVWSSFSYRLWFVILASSGIAWMMLFGIKAKQLVKRRESFQAGGFLIIWLPATLVFLLFFADMVNARYLLLGLPPLFLVTFQHSRRKAALMAFLATTILSFSLAVADYRFVNSYRNWVSQTIVPLQRQGFRFWSAAESGLRFYLEQKGIPTLSTMDLRPRGGDLIVKQTSFAYSLSSDLEPLLMPIRRIDLLDSFPVRTFSREAGAGFHDSHFGIVPYIFSRLPLDHLEIEEVSPFVKDLPQIVPVDFSSVPVWYPGGVMLKQVQPEMRFSIRLPSDSKIEYELEGKGSSKLSGEGITLENLGSSPAIWRNYRIVPNSWPAD
jgi:hypothetical protein